MMGQQHRLASETPFDAIQMTFRWRTDDGPLIVVHVSGSNLSSSFKNKQRKKAVRVGPPLDDLDVGRTVAYSSVVYNAYNLQQICPQNSVIDTRAVQI